MLAVGKTSVRVLETAIARSSDETLHACDGETDIFITPGYRFKTVDRLVTNFHLPRSTLFMLVSAFAGTQRMKHAYAHAKNTGYRGWSDVDAGLRSRSETQ